MTDKKSFVAYYSWWDVLCRLDDHQKALILEAMFSLGGVCEKPELDLVTDVAFIPIAREITANIEKWEKTREARREAGRKGGKASGKAIKDESQANEANAYFAKQNEAKVSKDKQSQAKQAVDVDADVDVDVDADVDADVDVVINNKNNVQKNCDFKQNKPSKKDVNAHFEQLWRLYPQKRGKNQVSDATKRTLFDVSESEMKRAIALYEKETTESGRPWLNGSTWFNGRYKDYLPGSYVPLVQAVGKNKRYVSQEGERDFSDLEE